MNRGVESGNRFEFLGHLRRRLAAGVPANPAHPLPPPVGEVPRVVSRLLDPGDLVGSFVRNAEAARCVVHVVDGAAVPDELLRAVVARHGVRRAVAGRDAEAQRVALQLAALGVEVAPVSARASAGADLGVTGAGAAIATTGTVVQDSGIIGGRTASLLPPVHLCVVPASRVVPDSAAVLRELGRPGRLPANLVLVTGPSRSGDIEQIIALGVHGPTTVEVVVLTGV